jgi:DNA replication protein DnaC
MLIVETKDKLQRLKLKGMLTAFEEQANMTSINELSFEERFGFLVDREMLERENRSLQHRLKEAKLKDNAMIEDVDFKSTRGIDKSQIMSFSSCDWINRKQNIIITGPTGSGKTYLVCAIANKACREGFKSQYWRISRLFEELLIGKSDGRYMKLLEKISKAEVLILDDFGISALNEVQRRDLLEVIEDRYNISSTIITSQIPIDSWYELIGEPTISDAIMDRIIHNSHKIILKGESMRKQKK